MSYPTKVMAALAKAPASQLDPRIAAKFLGRDEQNPLTYDEMHTITAECCQWGLASDFVMKTFAALEDILKSL